MSMEIICGMPECVPYFDPVFDLEWLMGWSSRLVSERNKIRDDR